MEMAGSSSNTDVDLALSWVRGLSNNLSFFCTPVTLSLYAFFSLVRESKLVVDEEAEILEKSVSIQYIVLEYCRLTPS